ncbi:hypothetical protein SXCC_04025 [Gluconacetobacter sp. SXCC-1]|uniref:Uncharacterized protein n=1 Tax=Komagataeibacter rhaeticus TaxID=215221 RepID=A0A181CD36_9PROT|nr:hypothetical protein [Komagataeibacter rhaeticus]ATU72124.1 hypothetical protein CT154_03945 [Komagataeibacter xylinus]EGG75115.1 hypothetical protein SXCC_04025 [Gluconacetobacter sp. SXCC-1]QIP36153.1 hypothetical protein GWK63_12280 [Komagataeibacter rhaeticus]QOC45912.1 hypothetical protein ICJ78_12330 [Komagataeibacter rhaeticus]WPP21837.1 hypothetical protein SCD25_15780 [Komagataeibacter rhaeticus]
MRPNRSPFRILPSRHSLRVMLAASLPFLALAATCDHAYSRHHTDEPTTFEGPQYGDTPPLNLNIASLSVVDRGQPGLVPGDLSGRAPSPPDELLKQLAHDRLLAAGSGGTGVFTIDRASILHEPGGILDGQLNVHLDVSSADGRRTGYAVAQVTRSYDPKKKHGNSDTPQNLNALTNMMLQDMNQELENQIRTNLGNWLVTPQAPGSVAAQPLDGSDTTTTDTTPATGAGTMTIGGGPTAEQPESATPAATPAPRPKIVDQGPDAIFPTGYPSDDTGGTTATKPRTQLRSPPPGNLTLPGSSTN